MPFYKPPIGSILFNFTDSGYVAPDFLNINFTSFLGNTSDLQAAITISQLYTDSTHTYTKSCRKIVVGYSNSSVQTITLPCLFGGIRDLFSYIQAVSNIHSDFKDLSIDIFSKPFYTSDLSAIIQAHALSVCDLISILNVIEQRDLPTSIRSQRQSLYDLTASVASQKRDYADLNSSLNIIEIKNLPVSVRALRKSFYNLLAGIRPQKQGL